ncbi:hypothetical protein [Falsihalocynthiibacter arcticus]|uniref:Thiol:disulfide interchange protein DsbD N-terminal domain-containing protein n=1 Tax=Falsihalocynthiibacter arcticus TaxID=1579316 RepID=A0A126V092_9RHOB|nr:hypothetical protein [Falsihalocynthiibacter arcticus]AML51365.1 hypothetical protein RC74_08955 [Falsihalocynthiibacter arcticus]
MKRLVALLIFVAAPAFADPAVVKHVVASQSGAKWRFDVSILHPDSGWDHYADGWKIIAPDGSILGQRSLAHPHENEQPFTRSVTGITIPDGVTHVFIQANCLTDGETSEPYRFDLK